MESHSICPFVSGLFHQHSALRVYPRPSRCQRFLLCVAVSLLGWTTLWVLHPQVDTGVPTSWLLCTWRAKRLFQSLLSLLGQHPEMALVGQKVICYKTVFYSSYLIVIRTSHAQGFQFLSIMPTLVFFGFLK